MPSIFEIDNAILSLFDEETGELLDYDKFDELQIKRNEKIENTVQWVKELKAESGAIREEIQKLSKRAQAKEQLSDKLKKYIAIALNGSKFESSKCTVRYRKSLVVEISDVSEFINNAPSEYLIYKAPEPNKTAIKKAIQSGESVQGAALTERVNTIIR